MPERRNIFTDEQIQTARFAKAFSHPVRIYILQLLEKQSCCYSGDRSFSTRTWVLKRYFLPVSSKYKILEIGR